MAEQTLIGCAQEVTAEIIEETGKVPEVRAEFFDSGFIMRLRYQSIAVDRQKISTQFVLPITSLRRGGLINDLLSSLPVTTNPISNVSLIFALSLKVVSNFM